MDPYYGEIRLFAGTYAPQDWLFCDGSEHSTAQYPVLFAIIGNTYGGDGTNTFKLPDFRNMVPMNWGDGPGLTPRPFGTTGGSNTFVVTPNSMPTHSHLVNATSNAGTVSDPTNAVFAARGALDRDYVAMNMFPNGINTTMYANALSVTGTNQMQNLPMQQPYCGINFIICAQNGIWPPKPE